jgi:enoyl-CoA hydratase
MITDPPRIDHSNFGSDFAPEAYGTQARQKVPRPGADRRRSRLNPGSTEAGCAVAATIAAPFFTGFPAMAFRTLLSADRGAVRTLTINRPDKLNALNRETVNELAIAFEQARHDAAVRVVVLAGAGEKAFVAGADIGELNSLSPLQAQAFSRAGQHMMRAIERFPKPVIARIQGFALGGGMELAMSCHLRIAADKAKFGQPEINLGIIPGFGGTQRLARLAGRGAALELCLLGHQIDAARAYALGTISRVVAADQLDAEIEAVSNQLAASAPNALAGILDAVLLGEDMALDQALEYETNAFALCCSTADMREGTQAFLERRKPQFTGQ